MRKLLYIFLGLNLTIDCSDGNEILGPCYISPNPEIICTEEYDPVCACNNLVYGNSCEAEKLEISIINQLTKIVEKSVAIKLYK